MWTSSPEWKAYLELITERPSQFKQSDTLKIITDEKTVNDYCQANHIKVGVLYRSAYNILVVDLVLDGKGRLLTYERILPNVDKGAIVTVPIYQNKFALLERFRHSMREIQYAFPRGYGEPGISAVENVEKELREEIGANEVSEICFLGSIVADSGLSGAQVSVYSCQVNKIKLSYLYEGISNIRLLSETDIDSMIENGMINDGFTLAAYCLFNRKRPH